MPLYPVSLTRLFDRLDAIRAGTAEQLQWLSIGDSLGGNAFGQPSVAIDPYLMQVFPDTVASPYQNMLGGGSTFEMSGTAARLTKTQYGYTPTGTVTDITAGTHAIYAWGGASLLCDRIGVPLIQESGAGSVKVEVCEQYTRATAADSVWRSPLQSEIASGHTLTGGNLIVSCAGASGINAVKFAFPTQESRQVKITHASGGTVRTMDPWSQTFTRPAINHAVIAEGSNGFQNVLSGVSTFLGPYIAAMQPDVIALCSDDDMAAYQNFLPILKASIAGAGLSYAPTVILWGNPGIDTSGGISNGETGLRSRIDYCATFAASENWESVDGLEIMGGLAAMQSAGYGIVDGIHLTTEAWDALTSSWVDARGILDAQMANPDIWLYPVSGDAGDITLYDPSGLVSDFVTAGAGASASASTVLAVGAGLQTISSVGLAAGTSALIGRSTNRRAVSYAVSLSTPSWRRPPNTFDGNRSDGY